jgi:hypothetical protein
MGVLGRVRARDVELPVLPGVVVLARGVRVRGVFAAGGTAPGIVALGVLARGVAVVVVVVVVLPPQPATQHRATSTANPQLKLLMAEHSTPSFLWDLFSRGFAGYFTRAGERTRTADPLFTRQALYQLSYSGAIGGEDARQL